MIGFNGGLIGKTDTYARAGVNSGVWSLEELLPSKRFVVASGGAESDIVVGGVDYRVHVFNSSGTFTVTKPGFVEYLIHGGGSGGNGGSPNNFGNGGAAGVARTGIIYAAEQAHTITVGSGSAGVGTTTSSAGGSSSALGITATGGNGISNTVRTGAANADIGGFGPVGGFNGAGGAGAGSMAIASQNFGGAGFTSLINGTITIRGGGGGGGGVAAFNGGAGGGGGTGTINAVANTGSGGAGTNTTGGNGSDGVVIIRYIWK